MRLDFYQFCSRVRQAIFHFKTMIDGEWDPFAAAWLAYALSHDGIERNLPLSEIVGSLDRWSQEPQTRQFQRNLGPCALLCYLRFRKGDPDKQLAEEFLRCLEGVDEESKLSPLRDPEQVFLIALCISAARGQGDRSRDKLVRVCREQGKGSIRRRLLYAAALRELGEASLLNSLDINGADAGDIIAMVWWSERYDERSMKARWWSEFENIRESVALVGEPLSDGQRLLSAPELAMLYEALRLETMTPDANLLFCLHQLHPRVREISERHYASGMYVQAVFEATKVLNEFIQNKSGVRDKSEAELVQSTMKGVSSSSSLKIRFNDCLQDQSGKNEQTGLALIAEGVFKAFRNPKGHKPEDHPLVQLDAYEALDQLITISYLMKRIEKAK